MDTTPVDEVERADRKARFSAFLEEFAEAFEVEMFGGHRPARVSVSDWLYAEIRLQEPNFPGVITEEYVPYGRPELRLFGVLVWRRRGEEGFDWEFPD